MNGSQKFVYFCSRIIKYGKMSIGPRLRNEKIRKWALPKSKIPQLIWVQTNVWEFYFVFHYLSEEAGPGQKPEEYPVKGHAQEESSKKQSTRQKENKACDITKPEKEVKLLNLFWYVGCPRQVLDTQITSHSRKKKKPPYQETSNTAQSLSFSH